MNSWEPLAAAVRVAGTAEFWPKAESPLRDRASLVDRRLGDTWKMGPTRATYLLIIGDREALAWILRTQRMAFPKYRAREVQHLRAGDELFIHTTTMCFYNPSRDRSRIVGHAIARSEPVELESPVSLAGRSFELGCDVEVETLAPFRTGVELPPLVPKLKTFPQNRGWPGLLRRPLLRLDPRDVPVLRSRLDKIAEPADTQIPDYLEKIDEMMQRSSVVRVWD